MDDEEHNGDGNGSVNMKANKGVDSTGDVGGQGFGDGNVDGHHGSQMKDDSNEGTASEAQTDAEVCDRNDEDEVEGAEVEGAGEGQGEGEATVDIGDEVTVMEEEDVVAEGLQGASCTRGGVIRGKAIGNTYKMADHCESTYVNVAVQC